MKGRINCTWVQLRAPRLPVSQKTISRMEFTLAVSVSTAEMMEPMKACTATPARIIVVSGSTPRVAASAYTNITAASAPMKANAGVTR